MEVSTPSIRLVARARSSWHLNLSSEQPRVHTRGLLLDATAERADDNSWEGRARIEVGCVEVTCELQTGALEGDVCLILLFSSIALPLSSTTDANLCGFGNDSFSDVPLVDAPHLATTSSERQLVVAAST